MTPKARKRPKAGTSQAQVVEHPSATAKNREQAIRRTLAPIYQSLASASFIGSAATFYNSTGTRLEGAGLFFLGVIGCWAAYRAHLKGDF